MRLSASAAALPIALGVCAALTTSLEGQPATDSTVARVAPSYRAVRASTPMRVDGRLDEAAWSVAAVTDRLTQVEPDNGTPSAFRTTFRILFDTRFLYIGIAAFDTMGRRGVRVQDLRRKFDYFSNDLAGVVLDPLHDGRNSVSFQTNPYGAQRELQIFDGGNFNREWEGVWRTRSVISDSGWTSEIAIPWATLRYKSDGIPWNMNLLRIARRTNEQSAWSVYPRNLTVYRMDFAGRLTGLEPPPPSSNIQLRPYGLFDVARAGSGSARATATSPAIGGEIIWRPTTSLQIDATVRTDFAQAEVDRQVVNLRRFSVFFPERRQFFLENGNVFELGNEGNFTIRPFITRSIGLDGDGNPIRVQGGVRGVLRDARYNAGALLIRQNGRDSAGSTAFGVVRASRNFGESNRIGALAVVQRTDGSGATAGTTSTTLAADGFARLSATTTFEWMASTSDNAATGDRGVGAYSYIGRQSNTLLTRLITSLATRGYNPSAGFVSRSDVLFVSPWIIGDWRPSWRPSFLRSFKPALETDLFFGPRDGRLQEGLSQAYVDFNFQNGALIYPYVDLNFQRPTAPFALVGDVVIPSGRQDYLRGGLVLRTDASARVSVRADFSAGGFYGGTLERADMSARWAPVPRTAFAVSYQVNQLHGVGAPARDATTHLLAPEVRLWLNPRVQFSSFYQYNSDAKRGTLNARFSWEFAPLSYFYVVVNDRRTVRAPVMGQMPGLPSDQLLVKLVYLWQL
ncbi:MAG: carbohydrate binding family 9 domain-containing protein [Gemmatimonadaceae bacterium]|nr:carbohydrate binding family 9 domain-containing protein [Gemmatimonadaceae bacterium]